MFDLVNRPGWSRSTFGDEKGTVELTMKVDHDFRFTTISAIFRGLFGILKSNLRWWLSLQFNVSCSTRRSRRRVEDWRSDESRLFPAWSYDVTPISLICIDHQPSENTEIQFFSLSLRDRWDEGNCIPKTSFGCVSCGNSLICWISSIPLNFLEHWNSSLFEHSQGQYEGTVSITSWQSWKDISVSWIRSVSKSAFLERRQIVPRDLLNPSFQLKPLELSPAFAFGREFAVIIRCWKDLSEDVDLSLLQAFIGSQRYSFEKLLQQSNIFWCIRMMVESTLKWLHLMKRALFAKFLRIPLLNIFSVRESRNMPESINKQNHMNKILSVMLSDSCEVLRQEKMH
jgi:hypothetical protein